MTFPRMIGTAGALFVTVVLFASAAWLSTYPAYRQIAAEDAVVKLSFSHSAERAASCHKRTPEELAKLPQNLRKPLDCPRGRAPVYTELDIDNRLVFAASLPPSGLSGDGPSRVYRRFTLPAGPHVIAARLRDTSRTEGFDHSIERKIELATGQSLAIDFRPELGGFIVR